MSMFEREVDFKEVSLGTLGNGQAGILFDRELQRVLENIDDRNTAWKKPRKIVLEIVFEPSEARDTGMIKLNCSSKLVGLQSRMTTVHLRRDGKKLVALEEQMEQGSLGFEGAGAPQ